MDRTWELKGSVPLAAVGVATMFLIHGFRQASCISPIGDIQDMGSPARLAETRLGFAISKVHLWNPMVFDHWERDELSVSP
jgi:hypothetical protein